MGRELHRVDVLGHRQREGDVAVELIGHELPPLLVGGAQLCQVVGANAVGDVHPLPRIRAQVVELLAVDHAEPAPHHARVAPLDRPRHALRVRNHAPASELCRRRLGLIPAVEEGHERAAVERSRRLRRDAAELQ